MNFKGKLIFLKNIILVNENFIDSWARTLVGFGVLFVINVSGFMGLLCYGIIIQWICLPVFKEWDLRKKRFKQ